MNKLRSIILPSVCLIACAAVAACSARGGSEEKEKRNENREVLSRENNIEASPEADASPPSPDFLVRLENQTLTLYDLTGTEPCVLKAINIDTAYYPFEDIQSLYAGIPAYSKEKGYEIIENFTN